MFLNIINLRLENKQHHLDWGAKLAFFKEIQALTWLIFVTGTEIFWLVSSRIQQPNKGCMTRTTPVQSVQDQNSTRKNTLPCQGPLFFFFREF